MKKIYLVVAGALLILLIITSVLLSLRKKSTTTQKNSPFPTNIPSQEFNNQVNPNLSNESNLSNQSNSPSIDLSTFAPVETEDFILQFNANLNKIVVEKKTIDAEQKFADWANGNNYPQLINNPTQVTFIRPGQDPEFNPLIDFLNIFMNMGQGSEQSAPSPSSTLESPNPLPNPSSTLNPPSSNFTYFPQCGDLGDLSLPSGCNLCQAGCGPTAVAMIAASYLGSNYDPKAIVNIYRSKGYLLGCDGSRYSDAKQVLQSLGLKTTDYLVFNSEKSDSVVPDLKKYLASGWTFFTLASFCEGGCGHYFWITDIDTQGNIWAYDPAYGRYEIPYNENTRFPYPLYRLAFGVKK